MIPSLRTPSLLLDSFSFVDVPAIQLYAGNAEVARMTANIPHPYPEGAAEFWIGTHRQAFEEDKNLTLAIRLPSGDLVGAVSLAIDRKNSRAELGYWIGRPFWGNGYATEAARELIGHGFSSLALERITAHHLGSNPASGRVMEKTGMTFEGRLRRHMLKDGHFEDIVLYGILKSEYES